MKLIMAIVRPSKVEEIKDALTRLNISGMTVEEIAASVLKRLRVARPLIAYRA